MPIPVELLRRCGRIGALCVAVVLCAGDRAVLAALAPIVTPGAGMVEVTFPLPDGAATVYIPDDIAEGEAFSGTFEAPSGFVLSQGAQRVGAGRAFAWRVPGDTSEGLILILQDRDGIEHGRVALRTPEGKGADGSFRFPRLIQAGEPFPVHGPFDGDARTTHISVGGTPVRPLVESLRKTIARAPADVVGGTSGTVVKAGRTWMNDLHSLSIEMAPLDATEGVGQQITVRGLAGVDVDVPFAIGSDYFYVHADEIPGDGVFSTKRRFNRAAAGRSALLVIPQSRRDEVAVLLRAAPGDERLARAARQADALRMLDFDALPVATELLRDAQVGGDAAFAILALDEARALPLLFDSMPESGSSIQLIAFDWFISRPHQVRAAAAAHAHDAAHRVLRRVVSSMTAELALYVVGLTGSREDFPLLQQFHETGGIGTLGMREASEAALVRLGSRRHLDRLRAELGMPLAETATYDQGVRLTRALRKAGFAARQELVPAVCGHVGAPVVLGIEVAAQPRAAVLNSLAAIVDGIPNPNRRTLEEWQTSCQAVATR